MDMRTDQEIIDSIRAVYPGTGATCAEKPRYRCHKVVHALKIARVIHVADNLGDDTEGFAILVPADRGFAPFRVDRAYAARHKPEAGGYYVVYPGDGYASFSPAKAFEEGYTPCEPDSLPPDPAKAIRGAKDLLRIAGASGNWDFDPYPLVVVTRGARSGADRR